MGNADTNHERQDERGKDIAYRRNLQREERKELLAVSGGLKRALRDVVRQKKPARAVGEKSSRNSREVRNNDNGREHLPRSLADIRYCGRDKAEYEQRHNEL